MRSSKLSTAPAAGKSRGPQLFRSEVKAVSAPVLTVRNLQRKKRLNLGTLQEFSQRALQLCAGMRRSRKSRLSQMRQIEVLLISDRRMAALHRRFLNLIGPTDVITFQHGEIFVSVETAHRNALHYETSLEAEVRLYIIHGILHLLGYDDSTPAGRRTMNALQDRVLASLAAPGGGIFTRPGRLN